MRSLPSTPQLSSDTIPSRPTTPLSNVTAPEVVPTSLAQLVLPKSSGSQSKINTTQFAPITKDKAKLTCKEVGLKLRELVLLARDVLNLTKADPIDVQEVNARISTMIPIAKTFKIQALLITKIKTKNNEHTKLQLLLPEKVHNSVLQLVEFSKSVKQYLADPQPSYVEKLNQMSSGFAFTIRDVLGVLYQLTFETGEETYWVPIYQYSEL